MIRPALALASLLLLLAACSSPAPSIPDLAVTADSSGNWWVTSPDFSLTDFGTVRIQVEFENITGADIEFAADDPATTPDQRLDLWASPGISEPPFTLATFPSTTITAGQTFSYDVTVDVSDLPAEAKRIAFRANSITLGNGTGSSTLNLVTATVSVAR